MLQAIGTLLATLKDTGLTMVLAEQNHRFALRHADRAYLIEKGQIRHEAPAGVLIGSRPCTATSAWEPPASSRSAERRPSRTAQVRHRTHRARTEEMLRAARSTWCLHREPHRAAASHDRRPPHLGTIHPCAMVGLTPRSRTNS